MSDVQKLTDKPIVTSLTDEDYVFSGAGNAVRRISVGNFRKTLNLNDSQVLNDFAFSLDRVRRSAALAADVPHAFSTHLRMVHGHGEPGEGPREILAFADFYARGGLDVVRVGECRTSGRRIEVPFDAKGRGIVRAELMFTKDGADVKWDKRYWETKDIAEFDPASGRVVTELPEGVFAWIVNFTTDDGLVFSTKYSEAEQP